MVCTVLNILRIKGYPQAWPMARLREYALQWQYTASGTCCRVTACTLLCTPDIFAELSYLCVRILWMSIPKSVRVFMKFSVGATPFVLSASKNSRKPSLTPSLFSPSFLCTKLIGTYWDVLLCSRICSSSAKRAKGGHYCSSVTITYGFNRHNVQWAHSGYPAKCTLELLCFHRYSSDLHAQDQSWL